MDNACESPTDKSGETGESDETAAPPGGSGATDTDGIPEETEGERKMEKREEVKNDVGRGPWCSDTK